jgi:DNA-binding IclR family transcriptional regulator
MLPKYKPNNSLLKAVSILKSFTLHEPELSAAEISRKAGIPKMTTHRILATLTVSGLVERRGEAGKYRIGPELYMLGSIYLETTDVIIAAQPVVKTLNEITGENINLSIFDKGRVVIVMKEEAMYPFRYDRHVGSILPAYASAMGKAFLSDLTEAGLDSIYPTEKLQPITKKTIATKTELKLELEQIRETGFSFDQEGYTEGVVGIGSIIRGANGMAVAAVGTGLPVFRIQQDTLARLATLIKMGANLISYRLGYRDAVHPVRDIQEIRSWWEQSQLDSTSRAIGRSRDERIIYFDIMTEAKTENVL